MIQIINNEIPQVQYFKNPILHGQLIGDGWNGIGHVEFLKTRSITSLVEPRKALFRKDGMTDIGRDGFGARFEQRLTTFVQGATGLNQVIDNDHVSIRHVAILNDDGAQVTGAAGLAAHDEFDVGVLKEGAEALGGTIVGKGDAINFGGCNLGFEQWNGGLQGGDGVAVLEGRRKLVSVSRWYITGIDFQFNQSYPLKSMCIVRCVSFCSTSHTAIASDSLMNLTIQSNQSCPLLVYSPNRIDSAVYANRTPSIASVVRNWARTKSCAHRWLPWQPSLPV